MEVDGAYRWCNTDQERGFIMSKGGGKCKKVAVDVTNNPLGKWGAVLQSRNLSVQFKAKGPTVAANNPEELRVATLGAMLAKPVTGEPSEGQGSPN